jgi:integrase
MAIKAIEKKGKKVYDVYVNGFDARGKRIQMKRRSLDSLRKAEIAEFELKRELAKIKEDTVSVRWEEWVTECLIKMRLTNQPSTVNGYEKQLNKSINHHWKGIELKKITKSDVHEMIFEKIDNKISMNTRRWILDMIRRLFQMAVEDGILSHNPTAGLKVKVPEIDQKVLTNSEVELLLRVAKITNHRFYPVWVLALMTGMRSGELMALRWLDIDLEGRTIAVSKQWTNKTGFIPTKTGKNRIVPISDDLQRFLKELKLKQGPMEFVLPRLNEWENGEQAFVLRQFCEAIGITSVKFHDLRASFITNLLARGESLARVMAIVGHTQLKTTNIYLRKAGVDVQGGTEKLGYGVPSESMGELLSLVK